MIGTIVAISITVLGSLIYFFIVGYCEGWFDPNNFYSRVRRSCIRITNFFREDS